MSFELGFSPEFFCKDGEPYDTDRGASKRPDSVWQAIVSLSNEEWETIAREVFGLEAEYLTPEAVLDRIQETNTCSSLSSPVEVWIDEQGYHTLFVY